jgi:hypothetical protein
LTLQAFLDRIDGLGEDIDEHGQDTLGTLVDYATQIAPRAGLTTTFTASGAQRGENEHHARDIGFPACIPVRRSLRRRW